jgi:hypothetical protein
MKAPIRSSVLRAMLVHGSKGEQRPAKPPLGATMARVAGERIEPEPSASDGPLKVQGKKVRMMPEMRWGGAPVHAGSIAPDR